MRASRLAPSFFRRSRFACHAVKNYKCQVTTLTLSTAQHAYCRERFVREGIGDLAEVRLQDYREITGRFVPFWHTATGADLARRSVSHWTTRQTMTATWHPDTDATPNPSDAYSSPLARASSARPVAGRAPM